MSNNFLDTENIEYVAIYIAKNLNDETYKRRSYGGKTGIYVKDGTHRLLTPMQYLTDDSTLARYFRLQQSSQHPEGSIIPETLQKWWCIALQRPIEALSKLAGAVANGE